MTLHALLQQAQESGLQLRLVDGEIKVRGNRVAVEKMLVPLRQHKTDLIRWFTRTPANDPVSDADSAIWRGLHSAYLTHHWACPTCVAAGQGWGLRCGTGSALWRKYAD
jgi:hypothetical protein